jgi:glycosyltransferase involved in cell wall biosynthesis
MAPIISVIMATYNNAEFLESAVLSILNQSFKEFEFIIIDDCSTDNTKELLQKITDKRIKIIFNEKNLQLAASLNKGIEQSKGKYVVRMDSDDISTPNRIEKQVDFMEKNPEIGILGTQYKLIDKYNQVLKYSSNPLTHFQIIWDYLTKMEYPLTHATTIIRRQLLIDAGGYNPKFIREQDGELFLRLVFDTKFANLPDNLYIYRAIRSKNESQKIMNESYMNTIKIRKKCIEKLIDREITEDLVKTIIYPSSRRHRKALKLNPTQNNIIDSINLLVLIYENLNKKLLMTHSEKEIILNEIGFLSTKLSRYSEDFIFDSLTTLSQKEIFIYLLRRFKDHFTKVLQK